MTNVVNPALPHAVKPKTDSAGKNKQLDRLAFGEALTRTAKRGSEEKTPVQSDPRWRAPAKLIVAIGAVERMISKQPLEILASADLTEIDEPGEKPLERDGESEPNEASILAFPPISVTALHHPAFTVRRVGDNSDSGSELPKTEDSDAGLQTVSVDAEAQTETQAKNPLGLDRAPPATPIMNHSAPDTAPEPMPPPSGGEKPALKPELAPPEPADAKTVTPRSAIVIEQSTTALAPASTGVDLAEKLAAQASLISAPAKPEIPAPAASPTPVQAHSLKLQLHPAELGIVTASLRFAGEQLTIELQVETAEAHQRLSADSEAIIKTLRGLGYEIDRVTILQPAIVPPAPSRSDSDPSLAGQSRPDPQASDTGGSNNGGDRLDRRNKEQGGDGTPRDSHRNAGNPDDRTGGSLYI